MVRETGWAQPARRMGTVIHPPGGQLRPARWTSIAAVAVVCGLFVVQGEWPIKVAAVLLGLASLAVGVALMKGYTLVEIYCLSALWVSALSGVLRAVPVGPATALGVWTSACTVVAGCLLLVSPRPRGLGTLWPLTYFVILGGLSLFVFPPSVAGVQSLFAPAAFILTIGVTASSGVALRSLIPRVSSAFTAVSWVTVALYGLSIAVWGLGSDNIVGPRGLALFALMPMAWAVARWRYGDRSAIGPTIGLLTVLILSLSRLAIVVGLFLLPLSRISARASMRSWLRLLFVFGTAVAVFIAAFQMIAPLRDRFLEGDLETLSGGLTINVSGRDDVWPAVWNSYVESPWVGKGAGSSEKLLVEQYGFRVSLPHNEYLRILHDFGIVSLVLWLWGFGTLFWRTYLAWRRSDRRGERDAIVHLAAWLGLVALALAMITDNPLRYVGVLFPLAIMIGCSLGLASHGSSRPQDHQDAAELPTVGAR